MADSMAQRLLANAAIRPSSIAYYAKRQDRWQPTTWRRFVEQVRTAARALLSLNIAKGDRVAILGFNRPEWTIFDHAAMMIGGVPAGIYTTCSTDEVHYIAQHSEAKIILVENDHQLAKVLARRAELPALVSIVMMRDASPPAGDAGVLSWEQFEARGTKTELEATGHAALDTELDRRIAAIEPADLATLIYTSGTTGPPKAVMLSQHNLCWTASQLGDSDGANDRDCSLSYLPLSHIAEQMGTILLPATVGSTVYYAESIERVADNLKDARPTVFFGVPRIWEKFHDALRGKLREVRGIKKWLVNRARKICAEVHRRRDAGQPLGRGLELEYRMMQRLVTNKIRAAVGLDRVRLCVTGAAPISSDIIEFFASIDLPVHELYGQSEVSGPTSFNLPGQAKLGTVGLPMPGVEVRIAPDGEVLVRGPNLFQGYLKDADATRMAMSDGWMNSGDLGALDAEGYLTITGRKKEIIITSGGKNIAPRNIEEALKHSALIEEAVVIGDRRKFLTVLLTLNAAAVKAFAAAHEIDDTAQQPAIARELQRLVDDVNRSLARVEQLKRFKVLPTPFSIEGGELTPTLKIKRAVVSEKYHREIEAMYENDEGDTAG
jgi:long-chain acyl-CoA synthetase